MKIGACKSSTVTPVPAAAAGSAAAAAAGGAAAGSGVSSAGVSTGATKTGAPVILADKQSTVSTHYYKHASAVAAVVVMSSLALRSAYVTFGVQVPAEISKLPTGATADTYIEVLDKLGDLLQSLDAGGQHLQACLT